MIDPACIAEHQVISQRKVYFEVFPQCAMLPITDTHREFIVICHARRLDLVIAGLAEAVEKAQNLTASSTGGEFDTQVKTLISLSTALHKMLRDEKKI